MDYDLDLETVETTEMYARIIGQCAVSRVWFIQNVLGVEKIEDWQLEVLTALDKGETRVSVRSGHGVGKTAMCAWLALHFLLFRNNVKIPVTAPSSSQMKDGLIPETKLWAQKLPDFLREQLDWTEDRIFRVEDRDNNFISFRTARADAPEALAGIHADHVMAIVDEASGVPDAVYEAAQGTMSTPGAIFVLIGNPTRSKGYFYKTQTDKVLKRKWLTRKVGCMDSSRVDPDFIEDIIATYGITSNQYRVRVLGEFPDSNAESVIPKELVDAALTRDVDVIENGRKVWGIDPGRGGDPTGFCYRHENVVEELEEWFDVDLMKIAGRVHEKWTNLPSNKRPDTIYVDSIGLGAGLADRLRELGLPCVDVNVSESPAMKDRYPRLRAELWYSSRYWFEARNVRIADVKLASKLADELIEPEAVYTSSGKSDVESKAAMRARGVASPNLADALNITFAEDASLAYGRAMGRSSARAKKLDYRPVSVY